MAVCPKYSSIRSAGYILPRSVRAYAPVLIWPAFMATTRSAIVSSGFTGTVWNDGGIASTFCHLNKRPESRLGSNLVNLNENRVGTKVYPFLQAFCVLWQRGHRQPIDFYQGARHDLPAFPVFFVQTVFDEMMGYFVISVHRKSIISSVVSSSASPRQHVFSAFLIVHFRGRDVHCKTHIIARTVTGGLNAFNDGFKGFLVGFKIWCKSPSSLTLVTSPFWSTFLDYEDFEPMRSASELFAPMGIIINSEYPLLLSACSPPFKIFIIGLVSLPLILPPKYLNNGSPRDSAAYMR